jgi:anti-sigma factor RsiW
MKSPSFRDMEALSAYLDGQISPSERTRLEKRVQSDAALAAALQEFSQTRALLRRTPQRRAPRNFTLTPRMAGIRPPMPRLVPVFSWASAVAMLLVIFTLGAGLVGRLSAGTAAPILAAAPSGGIGGGPPAAATQAPALAAPATAAPSPTKDGYSLAVYLAGTGRAAWLFGPADTLAEPACLQAKKPRRIIPYP